MSTEQLEAVAASTDSLRNVVAALEAEETRLSTELATVKSKRVAVSKALAALEDTTPKRKRGRPRGSKNATAETPAEAVAA